MNTPKFGIKDYIFRAIAIKDVVIKYAQLKFVEEGKWYSSLYIDENGCHRAECWFCNDGLSKENKVYSLAINSTNDTFRCVECKASGTMIDYVMKVEQCDEKTAMKNIIESLNREDDVPKRFLKELE